MPVKLLGSTSGYTQIVAAAVAGNNTLTLPTTTGNLLTDNGSGSLSLSGNLTFTGTGNRITGDMSTATTANRVMFQSSVSGSTSVSAIPNTAGNAFFRAYGVSDPTNSPEMAVGVVGITEVRLQSGITGTGSYVPMTFYTGGSERMRIDTSGNVGIGTSTTGQGKLTVYSSSAGAPATTGSTDANIASRVQVSSIALDMGVYSAGQAWIQNRLYNNYASNYDIVLQPNGGNVGVGLAAPAYNLHVRNGAGNSYVATQYGTGTIGYMLAASNEVQFKAFNGTNDVMTFATGASERMRIDASGNVQVGGTTVANTVGYVNSRTNARAWVNFTGVTTTSITASYNVSSVTRNSTGNYTINWTTALADANYIWNSYAERNTPYKIYNNVAFWENSKTTSALNLVITVIGSAGSVEDTPRAYVAIFGN